MASAPYTALQDDAVYDAADACAEDLDALSAAVTQMHAAAESSERALELGALEAVLSQALLRATLAVREFEVELRRDAGMPPEEAARLSGEYDGARRRLQRLQRAAERCGRQQFGAPSSASVEGGRHGLDRAKATPRELIAMGASVQADSQLALTRAARTLESSKQVGGETLVALDAQHGKLELLRGTLGAVDAQYDQAARELRGIAAGAFDDTTTLVLCLAIVVGLVFIMSWRLSEPAGGRGDGGAGSWPTVLLSPLSQQHIA